MFLVCFCLRVLCRRNILNISNRNISLSKMTSAGCSELLEIDGSYLEGGGQILRNALSFSCILGRPVRITKIRAGRPNPGLSNQHLYGLQLLEEITGATVHGACLKSTEVEFWPGKIKAGRYFVNTKTAASITLVLQAALPVLIFGTDTSEVEVIGGTNVSMSPQVDFMTEVLRPTLEMCGVTFDFDLMQRGYYPRGGGRCKVSIPAVHHIKPLQLVNFGSIVEISGWCFVAGKLPLQLAHDMKNAAEQELQQVQLPRQVEVCIEAYKEAPNVARDNGSGVVLKAVTSEGCVIGASALGERKVDGNALGRKAAKELSNYLCSNTCIDCHVQDQLILFMALAAGESRIRTCALTNHTRTAIHVASLMVPATSFHVSEEHDGHVIISCKGIGWRSGQT